MKLAAPPDSAVRPMLDRVKVSLFNILQNRVPGSRVLDLFSGTGALGIEALSRGAESCLFLEVERSLVEIIRGNLEHTRLADVAHVIRMDALLGPAADLVQYGPFGLVLCDPPYVSVEDPVVRAELCGMLDKWVEWNALTPDAVLMIHHAPPPTILWPLKKFALSDARRYGKSVLSFFNRR